MKNLLCVFLLLLSCSHYIKLDDSIPRDFEFEETSVETVTVDGNRIVERRAILWYFIDSTGNQK